jgi:hypothetical protein
MRMMVKKDSITDILDHFSDEELSRIMILKSGLEDLNLILQEIEDTYQLLSGINLTDRERKNQQLRLLSLERYMAELNQKVNSVMGADEEKKKLS